MAEINQFLSKDAEKQVKDLLKLMEGVAKGYETAFHASKKLDDQIKKLSKSTKTEKENRKELTAIQREEARILKATATTKAKIEKIRDGSIRLLTKEQEELKKLNKELRSEVTETGKLEGAFRKLNNRRSEAAKRLKDLIASERASTKEIQKAQRAFDQLDKKVQKANRSARQFQSNVGNYPKLFGASTRALGGFLSAFGVVGGIALFARAITDAFKRIREFDKSIVELAGILGEPRKDLAKLEKIILDVAGSSTKTSGEVAKLATALATLGATEAEIRNLIEPVNNLAIGLKATSEEAAELLKGTLNAFGESSTSARRYADVIAKMRTSTALDFERIKDSLGFVAPTAKAVGLTIEGLGARIGVLVNNSVKASRAGRLLNSSFARLIKRGLSLDEALEQINNSTDKAKTASELFGTEAFGLGLILADNVDEVARLTLEYEKSGGTLDALVKNEMTSMDAKLLLLDSAFETFILTITKGDNFISDVFKGTIFGLTEAFIGLADAINGTDREMVDWERLIKKANFSNDAITHKLTLLSSEFEEITRNSALAGVSLKEFNKLSKFGLQNPRELELLRLKFSILLGIQKEREKEAQDELDRLAKIEAEKERIRQLELKEEIELQAKLKEIRLVAIAEIKAELIEMQDIAKDTSRSDVERNQALERSIDLQVQLIDFAREARMLNIQKLASEFESNRTLKNAVKLEKAKADAIIQSAIEERIFIGLLKDQNKLLGTGVSFLKTQRDQIVAINNDLIEGNEKVADKFIEGIGKRIKSFAQGKKDEVEIEKKAEEEKARIRSEIIASSVQLVTEIFTNFHDLKQQQLSDESNALELQRQTQLKNADGDKLREAQINAQFDKKQAAIKQKQFKAEQNASLIKILINTALAISAANTLIPPANIPAIIFASVIGAAQAAFVKSQKPPKFAKGSKGLQKDTHGIVGEAGRELLFMPGGGVALAQKETEGVFPKGTVIKTNRETEQILAANQYKASRENDLAMHDNTGFAMLSGEMAKDRKAVINAINEKNNLFVKRLFDGAFLAKETNSGTSTYLNKRFR